MSNQIESCCPRQGNFGHPSEYAFDNPMGFCGYVSHETLRKLLVAFATVATFFPVQLIEINGRYINYMSKFLGERTFTRPAIAER